jgi:hypothetical protein
MLLGIILTLILASNAHPEPARDPLSGRVRVLYVGDCFGVRSKPYIYMTREPLFVVTPIPSSTGRIRIEEEVRKLMRLYMPRSYREHVEEHDLVILSAMERFYYTTIQLTWFEKGVIEEGQGIMMVGGYHTFGGKPPSPSWSGTGVEDVLPVEILEAQIHDTGGYSFYPVPVDPEHPFCTSLDWSGVRPFHGMNIVKTRQSAVEVLRPNRFITDPLLVYWEVGEGSGIAHTPDWAPGWGEDFMDWSYFPDYVDNLLYFLARLEVPQDLNLIHAVRSSLHGHQMELGVIQSMANFVESFGGNSGPIQREISRISELEREAYLLYADQEYDRVMSKMDEIAIELGKLRVRAIDLKNRTLAWVFAIEWLVITGTFLVGSYTIWSLMVRRRLYREVGATRLSQSIPKT